MTGTPGDSAAGLAILQDRLQVADAKDADYLLKRHLRPTPRILQGQALRDLASAAIDISDGLISDLGHIVNACGCGARVNVDALPYSTAFAQHVEPEQALRWALSGVKIMSYALPYRKLTVAHWTWRWGISAHRLPALGR